MGLKKKTRSGSRSSSSFIKKSETRPKTWSEYNPVTLKLQKTPPIYIVITNPKSLIFSTTAHVSLSPSSPSFHFTSQPHTSAFHLFSTPSPLVSSSQSHSFYLSSLTHTATSPQAVKHRQSSITLNSVSSSPLQISH